MDGLEHMARSKVGNAGPLTTIGWAAALTIVVFGGVGVAASFLAPGLALASTLPTDATGAHPWIVDGGGEVANDVSWRVEIMLEYIALGLAVIVLSLRFGNAVLAKLQDWYEGAPLAPTNPAAHPAPAAAIPRPRRSNDAKNRRKLGAA